MKKWIIAALALSLQGCFTIVTEDKGLPEEEKLPDYLTPENDITVVTGLAYPEDTDWNLTGLDSPRARVVMYMDRELKANVSADPAAGKACCDPYMHFHSGGRLYCVNHSDNGTMLTRNGEDALRFKDIKYPVKILDDGTRLLTLWENEGGHGFVAMKNEEIIRSDPSGTLFRNVGVDENGNLCYFYSTQVKTSSGILPQYFYANSEEVIQMDLPKGLNPVYGLFKNGESFIAICQNEENKSSFELYNTLDNKHFTFMPKGEGGVAPLSFDAPSLISCCVKFNFSQKEWTAVMLDGYVREDWDGNDYAVGFHRVDEFVAGVRKSRLKDGRDILLRRSARDTLPKGYTVFCDEAVCIDREGHAKIGLSSKTGGKALLWSDGEIDTLGFRGIVTGVHMLEREKKEEVQTIRTTKPTEGRNHIFTPS